MDSCLILHCGRMNVGVAHSEVNPNTRVMNSQGIWLAYIILVGLLHVVLLSIPFFSIPVVWTLTNVIHNLVSIKPHPISTPGLFPTKNNIKSPNIWGYSASFEDLNSWAKELHSAPSNCSLLSSQAMYVFLHMVKGTPFETPDQGKARLLTHWEQMDYGLQFTSSRKFLNISPIVL